MKLVFTLCCLWLGCLLPCAAQSSKVIHQTFTLDGAEKVNINVVGSRIEMKETKGSRILVETTVKLSMPNDRLLDYVANSGRYDLEKELDEGKKELILASKKSNNVLIVKGKECYEEISYIFYLPSAVRVVNNSTISNMNKE